MKKLSWNEVKAMFDMPNTGRIVSIKVGKHDASKRGYKHKHGMSRGQRKDAAKKQPAPMEKRFCYGASDLIGEKRE